jgi:hypothetical protein
MDKGEVAYFKVRLCITFVFCGAINPIVLLKSVPFDARLHSVQLQITGVL